jgi:ABC-type nitrate/sulfonate/bicarbonate transport system substrate-binding protein
MRHPRLNRSAFLTSAAGAALAARAPAFGKDPAFTDWGWPQPYERVSDKSVAWLKSKGWWPLRFGYQPPWMVEGTVPPVIVAAGLDKARGLEIQIVPFLAGPPLNEAIVAGTLQIGNGGDFPITSLILANAPVTSLGYILTPVLRHAIMVRPDSPMSKPEDLKGKSVGLVAGSSAEFALVGYLEGNGIDPKDVSIKNMPIPDQATFPRGIDAVLPWEPTVELMQKYLKNAKIFADTGPYQMYWGATHVRKELADNVPDVVQALADIMVEATLWQRLYPDKATDIVKKDQSLEVYPRQLLYGQNVTYANNLKPTQVYPFADVYAVEGARIAKFLYQGGRAKRLLTEKDYLAYFANAHTYMNETFKKLGWSIPKEPPFFAPGVTLATYRSWLAEKKPFKFVWPYDLSKAQAWPGKGDLQKPWSYAGKTYRPS